MIAGIDGDVLRYELGAVSIAKEEIFDIVVEKPWSDKEVHDLVDYRMESIIERSGAKTHEVYLTGPGNYRETVATIKPYKGGRKGLEKPYHWETVSNRLKDHWGAVTFNGIEADDWLGVRGTELGDTYVACSRDKDIRQIPECHHYSWPCGENQPEVGPFSVEGLGKVFASFKMYGKEKKSKAWKLEGHGQAFLWGQLLCGDSVDNIPGCKGIGAGSIEKIFSSCQSDEEYFKTCVYEYQKAYGTEWEAYLVENMRLLFLIRDRSWLDLSFEGNEVNCKVNQMWELPYDTTSYFY